MLMSYLAYYTQLKISLRPLLLPIVLSSMVVGDLQLFLFKIFETVGLHFHTGKLKQIQFWLT